MHSKNAMTPGNDVNRPLTGRRRRSASAPATGPSALVAEIKVVTWSGEAKSRSLVRNEPRKIPASMRAPPIIAATMAIPAESQIGAGKSP